MKRWSNSETRICLQFSLFSFVLKFRICHKVHQRKCKFGSKSKSSWHWLCSPIVLHCSHFILFQFKGCLGNVQQPHQFCTGRGHFVMIRNDDDIILNFLVPPIFIQIFFCYKQPPSFYPFSVHSERLGIVSCSGDLWTLWNNNQFLAKDPIPRNFQFIVCARWDYFPRLLRIGHYSSCQTYQCASKSSILKVF